MTKETLIDHVHQSIERAQRHQSWIDESCLFIRGFSTGVQRRIISNLCHLPKADPVYAEAGLFGGALICSAINNNPDLTAFGIEDASQPFGDATIGDHLKENIAKYRGGAREVTIIDHDFFTMDLALITKPVDCYVYDAVHSFSAQRDAVPFFLPALADLFIYVCDDFDWPVVSTATREGLASIGDKITVEKEWVLTDGIPDGEKFHNGLFIAVIAKK